MLTREEILEIYEAGFEAVIDVIRERRKSQNYSTIG
jgi:hypothetical protein